MDSLSSPADSPLKRGLVTLLFMLALMATLAYGPYWPAAAAGWAFLAFCFFRAPRCGVHAAFFHAAFFQGAGILPDLFFTLKHFHLTMFLILTMGVLSGNVSFLKMRRPGYRLFWPVGLLLLVSVVGGAMNGMARQGYLLSANMALVLGLMLILAARTLDRPVSAAAACAFFVAGTVVQCTVNFYNLATGAFVFNLDLVYNNQNATLLAMTVFYCLALFLGTRHWLRYSLALTALGVTGGSLLMSLSRTGWLSFLLPLPVFFYLVARFAADSESRMFYVKRLAAGTVILTAAAAAFFVLFPVDADPVAPGIQNAVWARVSHFYQILDPDYWQYTLADVQNFGFFGISRLNQLFILRDLMKEHWLIGIGFVKMLTDFHGFYFTLLGAAGVTGVFLFLIFVVKVLGGLEKSLQKYRDRETQLFGAACFCAILAWLISSVTQSMFIHFSVWLQPVIALLIMRKRPVPEEDA